MTSELAVVTASPLAILQENDEAQTRAETDMQLISVWLGAQSDRSPHTLRAYKRISSRFLATLGVGIRSAKIEDVKAAFDTFRVNSDGTPASHATMGTYIAVVKSLFGFARTVGYCQFNVAAAIKSQKGLRDRGRAQKLISEVDARLMIRAARNPRDQLMMQVAYYGALRVSELVSIQWGMVTTRDTGEAQLSIIGKGNQERQVLLTSDVSAVLMKFRTLADADRDRIFKVSDRRFNYIIKAAAKYAGVTPKMSPHWFRHAHASHALDNGAPISLVSKTLGHASISTTGVYSHARPNESSGRYLK